MDKLIPEAGKPSNFFLSRVKLTLGDITQQDTDAVVTAIPQNLEYRGQINGAILKKAGARLDEFVLEHLYKPRPGDVYAVPGFDLPCRHIMFCIMPVFTTDAERADRHLVYAARKSMEMARAMCLKSIAFPLLASGKHGYPPARAIRLIIQGILERAEETFEEVRIVAPTPETMKLFEDRLKSSGWKGYNPIFPD